MSCEFNRDTLEAFALSILDGNDKKEAAAHVSSCAECREFLMRRREMVQMLDSSFDEEPPEWLVQRTIANVQHQTRKKISWKTWIGIPVYAGLAVALVMVVYQSGLHTGRSISVASGSGVIENTGMKGYGKNKPFSSSKNDARTGSVVYQTSKMNADVQPHDTGRAAITEIIDGVQSVIGLFFENPVDDRTIYRELGVSEEVAALLL